MPPVFVWCILLLLLLLLLCPSSLCVTHTHCVTSQVGECEMVQAFDVAILGAEVRSAQGTKGFASLNPASQLANLLLVWWWWVKDRAPPPSHVLCSHNHSHNPMDR